MVNVQVVLFCGPNVILIPVVIVVAKCFNLLFLAELIKEDLIHTTIINISFLLSITDNVIRLVGEERNFQHYCSVNS